MCFDQCLQKLNLFGHLTAGGDEIIIMPSFAKANGASLTHSQARITVHGLHDFHALQRFGEESCSRLARAS